MKTLEQIKMTFFYMSCFLEGGGGTKNKRHLNLHNPGIYPVHSYSIVKIQLINSYTN